MRRTVWKKHGEPAWKKGEERKQKKMAQVCRMRSFARNP